MPDSSSKKDALKVLEEVAAQVSDCPKCDLALGRKKAVPGEGPVDARIMFIGEAPGFYENEQGRPFVGAAGKFLDELLAGIGMKRAEVFITNVVKCRPPGNRDPQPEEIKICTSNYLFRQIEAINPPVIVTLGRYSMGLFLPEARISSVHGQAIWVKDRLIIAMYHPAAALHQQNLRPVMQKDFAQLPALIEESLKKHAPAKKEDGGDKKPGGGEKPKPKQLSLF